MLKLPTRALAVALGLSLMVVLVWMILPVEAKKKETGLPDLTVDENRLAISAFTESRNFTGDANDCATVEGCVSGSGERLLLRFDFATPNVGTADLVLGKPKDAPELFEFSPCHGHYHFSGYAKYELLDEDGVVIEGRKQAFCLEDSEQIDPAAGKAKYWCSHQGISVGWQDVYKSHLDCQWLDITDVAPGMYELRTTVNPDEDLIEGDYNNNVASIFLVLHEDGTILVDP